MITTKRRPSGGHVLYQDGAVIGSVHRHGRKFSLFLDGVYWRKGEPNRGSGSTGTAAPTLKAAIELAGETLAGLSQRQPVSARGWITSGHYDPAYAAYMGYPARQSVRWNKAENEYLRAAFEWGASVTEMAEDHDRSLGGIQARLQLLGLIDEQPGGKP